MAANLKVCLAAGLCFLGLALGCASRVAAQEVAPLRASANQAAAAKTTAASPQSTQQLPATTGTLRGRVTDPSGAAIPGITVALNAAKTPPAFNQSAQTGRDGTYEIKGLPPGAYLLKIDAEGFQPFANRSVGIAAGQIQTLDVSLTIAANQQKVEVTADSGSQLSVSPENNAGAIILSGKDLEQFSDDPDQLASDLTALTSNSLAWGPFGNGEAERMIQLQAQFSF